MENPLKDFMNTPSVTDYIAMGGARNDGESMNDLPRPFVQTVKRSDDRSHALQMNVKTASLSLYIMPDLIPSADISHHANTSAS